MEAQTPRRETRARPGTLCPGGVCGRVADQSQNAPDAEEPEPDVTEEEEEFELEGFMAREQGANVLRRLADGVESGSVDLGREEGPVTVPEQFEVELEYEEEAEEAELDVELEWSMADGEAVSSEEDENGETD